MKRMTKPEGKNAKLYFVKALEELGLKDRFCKLCAGGARDATVHRWVQANPKLVSLTTVPKTFKYVRRQLGCAAAAGGSRPGKRPRFYRAKTAPLP